MRIVLLGAPGSGKGTQSQRLMQREHIPQISTGDLLRAAVACGSELGRKAKEAMEAGRLVEDALVLGMIRERLREPDAQRGFILDGFPRNLAQAQALAQLLKTVRKPLDAVVQLEVDYAELVRRISGRRTCADCGRVFNVSTSSAAEIEADRCQGTGAQHRLVQRPDDNEATVAERLRVYEEKTRPLIEFYREQGLLRVINAEGSVAEVTERLERALHAVPPGTEPPARKVAARKVAVRRVAVRRAAVRRAAVRSATARKAPRKPTSRKPASKAASGAKRKRAVRMRRGGATRAAAPARGARRRSSARRAR